MPARLRVEDGIRDIGLSAIGESRTSPAIDRRRVRRDDGNGASLHEEEKSHHVEAGGRRDGMHAVQQRRRCRPELYVGARSSWASPCPVWTDLQQQEGLFAPRCR